MGVEIERKFLVKNNRWPKTNGTTFRQGYLNTDKERTVRVRIVGQDGYLTIKGVTKGATRLEFEYEIPGAEAEQLLDQLCQKPLIEKKRYTVKQDGLLWEIDQFFGDNEGLVIAEVELTHEDQTFEKPDWLGQEVTDDARYFNANLVTHPFTKW